MNRMRWRREKNICTLPASAMGLQIDCFDANELYPSVNYMLYILQCIPTVNVMASQESTNT